MVGRGECRSSEVGSRRRARTRSGSAQLRQSCQSPPALQVSFTLWPDSSSLSPIDLVTQWQGWWVTNDSRETKFAPTLNDRSIATRRSNSPYWIPLHSVGLYVRLENPHLTSCRLYTPFTTSILVDTTFHTFLTHSTLYFLRYWLSFFFFNNSFFFFSNELSWWLCREWKLSSVPRTSSASPTVLSSMPTIFRITSSMSEKKKSIVVWPIEIRFSFSALNWEK